MSLSLNQICVSACISGFFLFLLILFCTGKVFEHCKRPWPDAFKRALKRALHTASIRKFVYKNFKCEFMSKYVGVCFTVQWPVLLYNNHYGNLHIHPETWRVGSALSICVVLSNSPGLRNVVTFITLSYINHRLLIFEHVKKNAHGICQNRMYLLTSLRCYT